MLTQGLVLMVIGMFMVFLFLSIMVVIINIMSFFVKFFPEETEQVSKNVAGQNNGFDEIAVVIASAKKFMRR